MGRKSDDVHAYNGSGFNNFAFTTDTMYKLAGSLPTQVYKIYDASTVKEFIRSVGNKEYELKDHLQNVRSVINDGKIIEDTDASGTVSSADQFVPEVLNFNDYYPFGAVMPGRNFNSNSYRYSINGQEKTDEISGSGNHTTALYWEYDTRLGRRWNKDPKPNPSVSDYACFNNNPIWNTDVLGDKPTPKQAAAMAAHVYGDKSNKILKGGWKVSGKDFGIEKNNSENGLHSQVYERTKRGKTEYVYATAGTEDMTDAKQDALQPLGLSGQYDQSMNNATKISDKLGKGTELTFTGHSLGGGEAVANAYTTGRDAITFNAAGVSPLTKMENSRSKVDAYIMLTDPLNAVQNNSPIMPDVNGTRHYVLPTDKPSIYNGHSMDNMLKSFEINPSLYQKSK